MSFTRFHDDPARIQKSLEEIKSQEQYVFNTPGVGGGPFLPYLSDPHVRLQKWGGNVHQNSINLESDLKGYTRIMMIPSRTIINYIRLLHPRYIIRRMKPLPRLSL